jgi:uracil DNA glycosylase
MNLNWEKNKHHFGNWADKIQPFFHLLNPIYEELQSLSKRGKNIFPTCEKTFRVFQETDINEVKVLVVSLCPYHNITREKVIIADGIALSCSNTNKEQPSLTKWYDALEKEFPQETIIRDTDLSYLCKQGIMMYNFGLTVENMKAESHNKLWEPFTKAFIEEVISLTGVPVIMLGKNTHKVEKWLYPMQWKFKLDHPSFAARTETDWDTEGVFKKVKKIVLDMNGEELKWWKEINSLTLEPEKIPDDFYF